MQTFLFISHHFRLCSMSTKNVDFCTNNSGSHTTPEWQATFAVIVLSVSTKTASINFKMRTTFSQISFYSQLTCLAWQLNVGVQSLCCNTVCDKNNVVVASSSFAKILRECSTIHSPPVLFFFSFFFFLEID